MKKISWIESLSEVVKRNESKIREEEVLRKAEERAIKEDFETKIRGAVIREFSARIENKSGLTAFDKVAILLGDESNRKKIEEEVRKRIKKNERIRIPTFYKRRTPKPMLDVFENSQLQSYKPIPISVPRAFPASY